MFGDKTKALWDYLQAMKEEIVAEDAATAPASGPAEAAAPPPADSQMEEAAAAMGASHLHHKLCVWGVFGRQALLMHP